MLFGAVLKELQAAWGIQTPGGEQLPGMGINDIGWGIQNFWQGTTIHA